MQNLDFSVDSAITNYVKSIDTNNINDTDVWLYKLDQFGQISESWTKVPSLTGNNSAFVVVVMQRWFVKGLVDTEK